MPKPPDYFFLSMGAEGVCCHAHDFAFIVESVEQLVTFLDERAAKLGVTRGDLTVMCSSSLDFPEDETNDPKLIALCREIRG